MNYSEEDRFILNENHTIRSASTYFEWIDNVKTIFETNIFNYKIRTYFIGLKNKLFITGIFFQHNEKIIQKYNTYDDALNGHSIYCNSFRIGAKFDDYDEVFNYH
jgi:hypothetical protein